jgi:hypothetical protein
VSSGHSWRSDGGGSWRWTCRRCGGKCQTEVGEGPKESDKTYVGGEWMECDEAVVRQVQES